MEKHRRVSTYAIIFPILLLSGETVLAQSGDPIGSSDITRESPSGAPPPITDVPTTPKVDAQPAGSSAPKPSVESVPDEQDKGDFFPQHDVDKTMRESLELLQSPTTFKTLSKEAQKEIVDKVKAAAQNGIEEAQLAIAESSLWGKVVEPDLNAALSSYEELSRSTNRDWARFGAQRGGQIALGLYGGAYEPERVLALYQRGSELRDAQLTRQLGLVYLKHFEDISNATGALSVAAEQGDPWAQYYYGKIREEGLDGQKPDLTAAIDLYSRAAMQGNDLAGYALHLEARREQLPKPDDPKTETEMQICRTIYFATNRNPLRVPVDDELYFGQNSDPELHYGYVDVVVRVRETNDDPSIIDMFRGGAVHAYRSYFGSETDRFFAGPMTSIGSLESFLSLIRNGQSSEECTLTVKEENKVLIFVHGFDNTFIDSIKRAAQIAYDIGFSGPVIVFSWPAQNLRFLQEHLAQQEVSLFLLSGPYNKAKTAARESGSRLDGLINSLNGIRSNIITIAHSLGNLVLLQMISGYRHSVERPPIIDELIMAAPDVPDKEFEDVVRIFDDMSKRLTIYVSEVDVALALARLEDDYRRLGDSRGGRIFPNAGDEINTIDTSTATEDMLGHLSAESTLVVKDWRGIIVLGQTPVSRGLFAVPEDRPYDPKYWRMRSR